MSNVSAEKFKAVIERAVRDNQLIAERNLAHAKDLNIPLIDPIVERKFFDAMEAIAGVRLGGEHG